MQHRALFAQDEALVRARPRADEPAYLLVNSVEYHGPHLSLLNDHLVSSALVRELHTQSGFEGAPRW